MSHKFEQSISEFFEKHSSLEFLDLELPKPELRINKKIEYNCFEQGHRHKVYSADEHLNFLSDINLNHSQNLNYLRYQINLQSKVLLKNTHKIDERLTEIEKKVDILAAQQKVILRSLPEEGYTALLKSLLTKQEARKLFSPENTQNIQIAEQGIKLAQKIEEEIGRIERLIQNLSQYIIS